SILSGSTNTVIGRSTAIPGTPPGNVISGSQNTGVSIRNAGTAANLVQGNIIGLDAAGTFSIANHTAGVLVDSGASSNTIGGTSNAHRNVISGDTDGGGSPDRIRNPNRGAHHNNGQGNVIGTNPAPAAAINNKGRGVFVGFGAKRTLVGAAASTPGQNGGNVIAGNLLDGVQIDGSGTTPATIQGNLVGTNAAGLAAVPNARHGIQLTQGANGVTIGGAAATARNVISGQSAAVSQGVEITAGCM